MPMPGSMNRVEKLFLWAMSNHSKYLILKQTTNYYKRLVFFYSTDLRPVLGHCPLIN